MEKKWFRVIDPLSPLYGCDVTVRTGHSTYKPEDFVVRSFVTITAMRRVDVFVGDRPFQLVAKEGEDLGLMIDRSQLDDSPLQDEMVETGTDRPHGLCLNESEMTRQDGVTIHIAHYERATQIALFDPDGVFLGTNTMWSGGPNGPEVVGLWEEKIVSMFGRGDDQDDIVYALRNS